MPQPSLSALEHTECASTQCASHLPNVGQVETAEHIWPPARNLGELQIPRRLRRTSAEAQKAGGQDPLSSLVERLDKIWTGEPTNPDLHYDAIVRLF